MVSPQGGAASTEGACPSQKDRGKPVNLTLSSKPYIKCLLCAGHTETGTETKNKRGPGIGETSSPQQRAEHIVGRELVSPTGFELEFCY